MEWKALAAKLAAMGLPVLGKTIGTLVGGQIPIVGGMIAGAGENIGAAAASMIANALGVEPTPDAINTAIESKPTTEVVTQLQKVESEAAAKWPEIAHIVQSMSEEYEAALKDNESARQFALSLAEKTSPMQWAPPVMSILVVVSFTVVLLMWFFFPPMADPASSAILNILVGTLAAAFGQVVSYWLGSSAGSSQKNQALTAALIGAQVSPSSPIQPIAPQPPAKKK